MNLFRGLVLIMFSVTMSLLIVWERAQVTKLRYEIGTMEKRIQEMGQEEQVLHREVSLLKSPKVIAERVGTMQLGLRDPSTRKSYALRKKQRKRIEDYPLVAMRSPEHASGSSGQ